MKILVIEGERKIADSIKKGLELETYVADVAYDGEMGFDLASSGDYDVIVLDLMLPKMDGMTLCAELRRSNVHTPVLMLTAKGQMKDKVEGLNLGADDYLVKPFAFEELLARIGALLRRPRQVLGPELILSDLSLNTLTHEVKRSATTIHLTAREFALLAYLMRHAGHVVTKDQIMAHVWRFDDDILPNTVEVYIGYLRNKIDRPFQPPPLIHTVRGFGYKIGEGE